ncbi:hypothetical protein [Burkholderia ubonensis]|uniref:hypothetical protein n=1 Tax=Burkholderia ubonensis TaxID=101571 RepID=UPI000A848D77|nr:hypothetical protein [Burkholderia ubonensis]
MIALLFTSFRDIPLRTCSARAARAHPRQPRIRHGALGPVHANNGLALAARRAEREECDEANTERIRKEHDAAIGPSGGQPLE